MAVARLEAKIAIGRLLQRYPQLRLDGTPKRIERARFRGFSSMPMRTD
jgi:cytochrome P450